MLYWWAEKQKEGLDGGYKCQFVSSNFVYLSVVSYILGNLSVVS